MEHRSELFKLNANWDQTPMLKVLQLILNKPVFQNHFQTSALPHRTSTPKTQQILLYQTYYSISLMVHQDVFHTSTGKSVNSLVTQPDISLLSKPILSKSVLISESLEDIVKNSRWHAQQILEVIVLMIKSILHQKYHSPRLASHPQSTQQELFHP